MNTIVFFKTIMRREAGAGEAKAIASANTALSIAPAIFLTILLSCPIALADSDLETGIQCYKKQDLNNALIHFQKALKANPNEYTALYYSGIIYHRLGSTEQAEKSYGRLIQLYPDSSAAKNAATALAYLDPKYLHRIQATTTSSSKTTRTSSNNGQSLLKQLMTNTSADFDQLPNEAQIFFEPQGSNLVVDAYINNRPIKMVFDTGAEMVVVGKNHLQELGIAAPQGPATGLASGVGSGGVQKTWQSKATIKVGQIERKNFPITIQEDMPTIPLLGETFFKDFYYSIERGGDTGRGSIRFRKKTASTANPVASDSRAVPYAQQGNEMIVSVEINGRSTPMIFDTGAEGCVFTEAQIRQLGIPIPDDAQEGISMGIAGRTRARNFTISRMKLGSIIKTDVPISVVEDTSIPYPLLGQSFFGDLRYELDNQAHVIKIRR